MENKPKRPLTVLVAQIVLVAFSLLILFNIVYLVAWFGREALSVGFIGLFFLMLVVAIVPLVAFWGLAKRKKFGRYLSVLLFVAICVLHIYRLVISLSALSEFPWAQLGELIVYGVLIAVLLVLSFGLVGGKKVRQFFPTSEP